MQERDEFDSPDMRGAIGAIFQALDRRDSFQPRRPVWAAAIVVSLIVFLITVLVYSYPRQSDAPEDVPVPLIRADAEPIKVAPRDPGGMDIPYRDSTVFETLHADKGATPEGGKVENLLGDTESPVSREQLFAGVKAQVKVEGREIISAPETEQLAEVEQGVAPELAMKSEPEENPEEAAEDIPDEGASEQKVAAMPVSKPLSVAKSEKAIAEEVSKAEPAAGVETFKAEGVDKAGYFAQLASLRSNEAAKEAWGNFQKGNPALKDAGYRIKTANLGERGVYYRLQAGPFSESNARGVCAVIEAKRPGGCLVVKD